MNGLTITGIKELTQKAGITINGKDPWDITVHNEKFFDRVFQDLDRTVLGPVVNKNQLVLAEFWAKSGMETRHQILYIALFV